MTEASTFNDVPWTDQPLTPVYAIAAVVAVAFAVRLWRGGADSTAGLIRRRPAVLLPPLLSHFLLLTLANVPLLTAHPPTMRFAGVWINLSAHLMLGYVLVPAALWASVRLFHAEANRDGGGGPAGPPLAWSPSLPRVAIAYLVGSLTPLLVIVPALTLAGLGPDALSAALCATGAAMLVANVLTCPLFAVLVDADVPLLTATATAARFAVRRWWPLGWRVVAQLAVTGFLVVYAVEVARNGPPPLPTAPPPMPASGRSVWGSASSGGGGYSANRSEGWSLQLMWVLSASADNRWADEVAGHAAVRQPPLAELAIDTLTLLVGLYAVLSYSRVYLRQPVVAPVDRRPGFAVMPARA